MKYLFRALFVIIAFQSCQQVGPKSLKIAIAGLAIESSTFSPARTEVDAFHSKEGAAIFDFYPFLSKTTQIENGSNGSLH